MDTKTLIEEIKRLRVEVNTCIVHAHKIEIATTETNEGMKKLIEARMWYGESLARLGHTLPEEYRDDAK